MKKLVIIPTYNERENIKEIVTAVLTIEVGEEDSIEVLVVDDGSPDGTGRIVDSMIKTEPRLHHLARSEKSGLGKAYLAGFRWGLDRKFDVLSEMDADFSHRPEDLKVLLKAIESTDFVIGSRYVPGGAVANWGLIRKLISRGGSLYARMILGYPLQDWTGGFNIWRREVLESMDFDEIQSEGYSFQIELKYKALKNDFSGQEVPILFEDRRLGQSKMSMKIVLEAFYRVWMIRFA